LNEEKLCQLLANQTRALQKKRSQAASHAHHLPIKPPQRLASQRVPVTAAQVQTSSQRKTAVVVVQNSALQTPMPHALHAPRVHSLRLVLQKLMAQPATAGLLVMSVAILPVAHHMATAMIVHLAKTAVATRVVQSVQATVATIAHLVKTAADTRVVQSALHTVVQVQLPVVATVAK
jgi:hypothetical protein